MLIVFRTVFSETDPLALPSDEADRTVGTAGVVAACCRVGKAEGRRGVEGERRFVGLCVALESPKFFVTTGRLFPGLLEGKGGSAVVGGCIGGLDKTGSEVATAVDMVVECGWYRNPSYEYFPNA